jgi:hypothetical protein
MNNFFRSLALFWSLTTWTLPSNLHADTMSQISTIKGETMELAFWEYLTQSKKELITSLDLNSKTIPQKFKDMVKILLKPTKDWGKLSILVEWDILNDNFAKKTLVKWLKEMWVSEDNFFNYTDEKDEKWNIINVVNTLRNAIADFSTRVIIITDKKWDDWSDLQEIEGVRMLTFFINWNWISCKETQFTNNKKFPKNSKCINVGE